jgi:threonine dehydrogenase-like Zn-dependent dehydrogenase
LFGAAGTAAEATHLEMGTGWGVVVDATGNPSAIQQGLSLVRRAGTFAVFGVSSADARVEFSPYEVLYKELTIVGSNSVRHSFGRALALLASGNIPGDELLGEPVALGNIVTAFRLTREGTGLKTTVAAQS